MLPSTFEDKLKKEEELKKRLTAKLEVARFLQVPPVFPSANEFSVEHQCCLGVANLLTVIKLDSVVSRCINCYPDGVPTICIARHATVPGFPTRRMKPRVVCLVSLRRTRWRTWRRTCGTAAPAVPPPPPRSCTSSCRRCRAQRHLNQRLPLPVGMLHRTTCTPPACSPRVMLHRLLRADYLQIDGRRCPGSKP
jgi:LETM1-like protein